MGKGEKRSRSHSRERSESPRLSKKHLQNQIEALTKSVQNLVEAQRALQNNINKPVESNGGQNSNTDKKNVPANNAAATPELKSVAESAERNDDVATSLLEEGEVSAEEDYDLDDEIREVLGKKIPVSDPQVKMNQNLKKRWSNWISGGLSEDARKALLSKYPRNGDLKTEAPKVNPEVLRHLSDIAKKRDGHFTKTQSCVGTAISLLGSTVSLLLDKSPTAVDKIRLIENLWDTGKILCDVFHQQSVGRKSYITPALDKDIKTTLEATIPDEWLYGQKLNEQVQKARAIINAAVTLKTSEKLVAKKQVPKNSSRENLRGRPAEVRQVDAYHHRKLATKYRPKYTTTTWKSSQKTNTQKSRK